MKPMIWDEKIQQTITEVQARIQAVYPRRRLPRLRRGRSCGHLHRAYTARRIAFVYSTSGMTGLWLSASTQGYRFMLSRYPWSGRQ
jgi:hypothetical protein